MLKNGAAYSGQPKIAWVIHEAMLLLSRSGHAAIAIPAVPGRALDWQYGD